MGMVFVPIPPGSIMMGSPAGEDGRKTDERLHRVTLTEGYFMQEAEVTQGQWKRIMGDNPSIWKECGSDCPVDNVSFTEIIAFIGRLNRLETKGRYALPTEAQWEYACRAGTTKPFFFGECPTFNQINHDGRYPLKGCAKSRYPARVLPVKSNPPNRFGLYDMHGNVSEFCSDYYGSYAAGDSVDPIGPEKGQFRVFRGGNWTNVARLCRSAVRDKLKEDLKSGLLGFRLIFMPTTLDPMKNWDERQKGNDI